MTGIRTLVVWCPDWPVSAVGMAATAPGAVLFQDRVLACSAAARAAGVRRGQRVRDAQRRCPELVVADRDLDAEGRAFESVTSAVTSLTPRVEVVRPGICAFPARGAARYHGGEGPLRGRVRDAVAAAGFGCGVGIADGLFTAELAARATPAAPGTAPNAPSAVHGAVNAPGAVVEPGGSAAFLAPYPLAVLERPELADLLRRLGIRTLGEFAALPAGQVAGRFGADGALAHRLARGVEPRPPAPGRPAADLSVRAEFAPAADRADEVVFAAKRLAARLHEGLAGAGLACGRLAVRATFAGGQLLERLWRHDGELSDLAVAERVRWQLSAWRPEAAEDGVSGGGVSALDLVPDQLFPAVGRQSPLWGQPDGAGRVAHATARIQAMLGHHAITRPVLTGARGPADQVTRVPLGDVPLSDTAEGPWPGRLPAPAPAVVPARPLPAAVTDTAGVPVEVDPRGGVSAPPARVAVAALPVARVTAWTGPWPEAERWWDPHRSRRRARFQMVTADGHAYLLTLEGGRWCAEAVYD